jgi:hypothetical protein
MSRETARQTAAAFATEFAQLGYHRNEILGLFRAPFYTTVHETWELLGEQEISSIVDDVVCEWAWPDPSATHAVSKSGA